MIAKDKREPSIHPHTDLLTDVVVVICKITNDFYLVYHTDARAVFYSDRSAGAQADV